MIKTKLEYVTPHGLPLALVALGVFSCAFVLALVYSNQPPLDDYSFRQSQTALTAYWFAREGFSFAYQTPVAGYPWSIPFEFPIYQYLVALISGQINLPLVGTGRILSFVFLTLTLIPVWSITKTLKLPGSVFLIFIALIFSSPLYLYWGRSFMMETAAVFFSVIALKYFLDCLESDFNGRSLSLYLLFISLAIIQKSTTALPLVAFLGIILIFREISAKGTIKLKARRLLTRSSSCFLPPLMIGIGWVFYTDIVKQMNPLGAELTSSALSSWNWGSLEHRFSASLFENVIWERMFVSNLAGYLGLSVLIVGFVACSSTRIKAILGLTIFLALLPLFVFTKLHIVHTYYQTSALIFLLYGTAVALGVVFSNTLGKNSVVVVLALFVISNFSNVYSNELAKMQRNFDFSNRDYAVGKLLMRELTPDQQFVAFGNDWSSTLAFMSQRKSFTVPGWFSGYDDVINNPQSYVEPDKLAAVVSCTDKKPDLNQLITWAQSDRSWKIGRLNGCYLLTPEKSLVERGSDNKTCQGNIEFAELRELDGTTLIEVSGWLMAPDTEASAHRSVYISIGVPGTEPMYFQAQAVPRPDVTRFFNQDEERFLGFSRFISRKFPAGEYEVRIIEASKNKIESCNLVEFLAVSP